MKVLLDIALNEAGLPNLRKAIEVEGGLDAIVGKVRAAIHEALTESRETAEGGVPDLSDPAEIGQWINHVSIELEAPELLPDVPTEKPSEEVSA